MINLEVKNPMQGAAWRVLYDRAMPNRCGTRERLAEIQADFDTVLEWAKTQRKDIRAAYEWAAQKILADLDRAFKIADMNSQVATCFENIARPPE